MKEWYLIGNKTKPNVLGGYENQCFLDYKEDAFAEALETDVATTVLLYNHDLSHFTEIRGIFEGNVADTSLKSMERCILVPIGTLQSGDYIFFEDEYWIIDGRPGNNKLYEKAVLKECQYKLKWQKSDGTIIERWGNLTSASKYDIGESGNNTIVLSSNNFTILIPHDEDGMTIDEKRVFIDSSAVPKKVFKITRDDDVLFLHGNHGGTLSLIADKTEFNPDKDNQELRICDYIDPSSPLPPTPSEPDETTDLSVSGEIYTVKEHKYNLRITYDGKNCIFAGDRYKLFSAVVIDEHGNFVEENVEWKVTMLPEQEKYIIYEIQNDNSINIKSLYNKSILGTNILLTASVSNVKDQIYIDIGGGI